jgi:hypothetical protein
VVVVVFRSEKRKPKPKPVFRSEKRKPKPVFRSGNHHVVNTTTPAFPTANRSPSPFRASTENEERAQKRRESTE